MTNTSDGGKGYQNPPRALLFAVLGVILLVAYFTIGFFLVPPLLAPIGCSGTWGDEAVDYGPVTNFNISYNSGTGDLTIRHSGGDTLPARRVERLEIRISAGDSQKEQVYQWGEAGGEFPIRSGDSLTISNATVHGRSLVAGDVVRVDWVGTWEDPLPDYCPSDHVTSGSVTLAKRTIG